MFEPEDTGQGAVAPPGSRTNIISRDRGDIDIAAVRSKMQYDVEADDVQQAALVLGSHLAFKSENIVVPAGTPTPEAGLDLIGHSTGTDNYLLIGNSVLSVSNVESFCQRIGPMLRRSGVQHLRLLGCSTATTPNGWEVIQGISGRLGISVYGTRREIAAGDYGSQGFMFPKALYASSASVRAEQRRALVESPPEAIMTIPLERERLRLEKVPSTSTRLAQRSVVSSARVEDLWTQIEAQIDTSVGWSLPGLLALPLQEIFVPADGDGFYKVQFLLNYQVIRVFMPHDQYGILYRVKESADLRSLSSKLD